MVMVVPRVKQMCSAAMNVVLVLVQEPGVRKFLTQDASRAGSSVHTALDDGRAPWR